jgi:CheY-like chemotaxis protein
MSPIEEKLLNILLVEDDSVDVMNVQRAFVKNNITNPLHIAFNGVEALNMLRGSNGKPKLNPSPRIILLDINMPKMNGWDFLEQYEYLSADQKAQMILIMLSTSFNSEDRDRALSNANVKDFANKYLNKDSLVYLLRKHFPDHFEALG